MFFGGSSQSIRPPTVVVVFVVNVDVVDVVVVDVDDVVVMPLQT